MDMLRKEQIQGVEKGDIQVSVLMLKQFVVLESAQHPLENRCK